MMKIGVMPDSFRVPFKESIILARDLGADGVQPYIAKREISPLLSKSERKAVAKFIRDNGLEISAVCADFGSAFYSKEDNEAEIQRMISMLDEAVDMGANIATTHIGHIPDDETSPIYVNTIKTIRKISHYAEDIGVTFATETGPEKAYILKGILDKANAKAAKVNLDPANFVMCCSQDPVEAVHVLKDYIVHTHAKDGTWSGTPTTGERPLGEGNVPFIEYLAALRDIGYDGYLTIERECGENPIADIKKAYDYLRSLLKKLY
ncbi:MAG: sugar phosphate isomerase/epimerase [Ruminococcaceae bacterium]|nr:sugar phosphate isomerase/epimerase [Oscillospiraceae bacterium]